MSSSLLSSFFHPLLFLSFHKFFVHYLPLLLYRRLHLVLPISSFLYLCSPTCPPSLLSLPTSPPPFASVGLVLYHVMFHFSYISHKSLISPFSSSYTPSYLSLCCFITLNLNLNFQLTCVVISWHYLQFSLEKNKLANKNTSVCRENKKKGVFQTDGTHKY